MSSRLQAPDTTTWARARKARLCPLTLVVKADVVARREADMLDQQCGHFGAGPAGVAASGGTIFITNEVGFSLGPNGPGTLFFTGGTLLRKVAIASTSSRVRFANACHGMIGASTRPPGRWPLVIAATISSVDHLPRPVSWSGVRLGPWNTPRPGISNPTSEPPRKRAMSGLPKKYPGVWQSLQPPNVTRYLPRSICAPWETTSRESTTSVAKAITPKSPKRRTMRDMSSSFNDCVPIESRLGIKQAWGGLLLGLKDRPARAARSFSRSTITTHGMVI